MKRVAVIGGGIVGASTAYFLSQKDGIQLTIFDDQKGQATKAAAGIISPWLSRRRNKKWYRLVKESARFYPEFLTELTHSSKIPPQVYKKVGTLLFKKKYEYLKEMKEIGEQRRVDAPEIGQLNILSPEEIKEKISIYDGDKYALWAEGGARVDGSELTKLLYQTVKDYGGNIISHKVIMDPLEDGRFKIQWENQVQIFDRVVLATGAWLPQMLEPLGYSVDVRPQKGQLIEIQLPVDSSNWPVIMPEGESDFIPFDKGRIIIGATHENDMGYDLEINPKLIQPMVKHASEEISSRINEGKLITYRSGTRAYTSDFAPFFGEVPCLKGAYAASGLGSTGLTAGPLVGKILAQLVTNEKPSLPLQDYPIENYIYQPQA